METMILFVCFRKHGFEKERNGEGLRLGWTPNQLPCTLHVFGGGLWREVVGGYGG